MASNASKFSAADDEKLIGLVRDNPDIYMLKSKTYRSSFIKNNTWKIIAEKMGKDQNDCKARWKNIRDYYQRIKRQYFGGTGTCASNDDDKDIFPKRFEHLNFLENTSILEKRSVSDNQADTSDDNFEINQQEIRQEPTRKNEPPKKRPKMLKDKYTLLMNELKKARAERTSILKQLANRSHQSYDPEQEFNDPSTCMFFKSMAATVSMFPPIEKARVKAEIMNIVSQFEIDQATQPSSALSMPDESKPWATSPNYR